MKMKKNNVLFFDASKLKKINQKKIFVEKSFIFIFSISVLILILYLLGPYSIIGFFVAIFYFYPYPYIPNKYEIKDNIILCDGKKKISIDVFNPRKYKLQMNLEEKYISIIHRLRGEYIRLYSEEPKLLYNILKKRHPSSL